MSDRIMILIGSFDLERLVHFLSQFLRTPIYLEEGKGDQNKTVREGRKVTEFLDSHTEVKIFMNSNLPIRFLFSILSFPNLFLWIN